jgi:fructokinase
MGGRSDPVVVAGEALVDLVPEPGGALRPLLGGGPFNTARALGRLGVPTAFVGAVSRDPFGNQLAATLAADGVRLEDTLRTELPTSLAVAHLDAAGSATYRFYFGGSSAESLTPAVAVAALPHRTSAIFAGGLGLVLEPLSSAVDAIVERAASHALVMVDPNVRPSLIHDWESYSARLKRIVCRADVVKVSDDDLRALAPGRAPETVARALLEQGPSLVLLTLGADGAIAFGSFGSRRVAAPRVTVADTIGAGDTFSGCWLGRWFEAGFPLSDADAVQDATEFACRAAAVACSRQGAVPPRRQDIPPR